MTVVVDYAFPPHPMVAALRAAGAVGVCRYLSLMTPTAAPKVITKAEYEQLLAAGLAVVLNWEFDARDYRGGAMAGAAHAREAINQARALGYPNGCAIIGSADCDMTAAEWAAPGRPYYSAFSTGLRIAGYRAGIYGPWDVLEWARRDDVADVFWQAGMSTAWSAGRNRNLWPAAHLRQRRTALIGGADCDINDIIQSDYGQTGGTMTDPEHISDPNLGVPIEDAYAADRAVTYGVLLGDDPVTNLPWQGKMGEAPNVLHRKLDALKVQIAALAGQSGVTLTDAQVATLGQQLAAAIPSAADVADEFARRLGNG